MGLLILSILDYNYNLNVSLIVLMNKTKFEELVKKALMLETQSRTAFLADVEDEAVKEKLAFILKDDTESTDFIIKTSAGSQPLEMNPMSDFESGDKIKQFTIIKLIAKGGMGCVYLAYDEKLKRNVAIKTIRSEYLNSKSSQKRFQYEAQILSRINHPSICQIYDYIDFEDGDLLVLELVNGKTLHKLELTSVQILDVFIQIASALVAAHEEGIIHRDLKPDNIMLTETGKVKILDFGIAKSKIESADEASNHNIDESSGNEKDRLTKAGSLMGTLIYMSPEQAALQDVSKASDIYSFAIIMHEMLTGGLAYKISDTEDLLQQVIKAKLVYSDKLPTEYTTIIKTMTDIEPCDRPEANEVLDKLLIIKEIPQQKKRIQKYLMVGFIIALLVIFALYQWFDQQQTSQLTSHKNTITQEIKALSTTKEKIYTLPLHDITQDIMALNEKKESLLEKIESSELLTQADKLHLKGNVYYANQEFFEALLMMEKSWQLGNNSSKLAKDLAYTNSLAYYYKGYKIADDILTVENNEKLKKQYFVPALRYLDKSGSTNRSDVNIPNAILLWQDNKPDAAISMLDEIVKHENWLFEAYLIKADILIDQARELYKSGNIEDSIKSFDRAELVYNNTIKRARSYPSAYRGLCILKENYLVSIVQKLGFYEQKDFENAIQSCQNRLLVEPHDKSVYLYLASLNYSYSMMLISKGIDSDKYLRDAGHWIELVIEDKPDYNAYLYKGSILNLHALKIEESNKDPTTEINEAIEAFEKAIALDDTYQLFMIGQIMNTEIIQLQFDMKNGKDLTQTVNEILSYYNLANKEKPETIYQVDLNNILASAYVLQVKSRGLKYAKTIEAIEKAKHLLKESIELSNEDPVAYYHLAELQYLEATVTNNNKAAQQNVLNEALGNINTAISKYESNVAYLSIRDLILEQLDTSK